MAPISTYHPSDETTLALIISTGFSILGCTLVIGTYVRWRRLRRHPASLIVVRSALDLLLCVEILVNRLYHWTTANDAGNAADCFIFSGISEFLAIAAELFSLMLAMDLYFSITNPFTNYKSNLVRYHSFTWSISALFGILVLFVKESDGTPIYGRDNYLDICWLKRGSHDDGSDLYFYLLFVIPLVFIYTVSLFSILIAQRRLARGLPETFELRSSMFRSSMRFVVCYLLYWVLAGAVYGIISLLSDDVPSEALDLILAFAFGGRGVVTFGVWLLTYGQNVRLTCRGFIISGESTSMNKVVSSAEPGKSASLQIGLDSDNSDLRPHLNHALRKEILSYATLGIAKSVRRAELNPDTDGVKPNGARYNFIRLSRHDEKTGLFSMVDKPVSKNLKGNSHKSTSKAAKGKSEPLLGNGYTPDKLTINLPDKPQTPFISQQKEGFSLLERVSSLTDDLSSFASSSSSVIRSNAYESLVDSGSLDGSLYNQIASINDGNVSVSGAIKKTLSSSSTTSAAKSPRQSRNSVVENVSESDSFTLIDFEPQLFARMRSLNGISSDDYINSLKRTRKERFSEGSSGAFLYFSGCDRFVVKTMTYAEYELLMKILRDYVRYMEQHPHSLIVRFFGCHALTMYGTTMYFMVLQNVLMSKGATVHERYDLKGSWVNRHSVPLERGQITDCRYCGERFKVGRRDNWCPSRPNQLHEPNTVLRDADWQYKLRLDAEESKALGDMIVLDTEFLRRHQIMDYSLLLGIHHTKYRLVESSTTVTASTASAEAPATLSPISPLALNKRSEAQALFSPILEGEESGNLRSISPIQNEVNIVIPKSSGHSDSSNHEQVHLRVEGGSSRGYTVPFFRAHRGGLRAVIVEGPGVYFAGIIDVLQAYTWEKWFENLFKTRILLYSREGISCIRPDPYAKRFRQRVINQLIENYHNELESFEEDDFT
jgi:hypothetical protein